MHFGYIYGIRAGSKTTGSQMFRENRRNGERPEAHKVSPEGLGAQYSISPCLTAVEGLSVSCIGPVKCGAIFSPSKIYAVIDGLRMTHSPSHTLLVHLCCSNITLKKKICCSNKKTFGEIIIPSSCKLLVGPNREPT
jgi:hypothetical protein